MRASGAFVCVHAPSCGQRATARGRGHGAAGEAKPCLTAKGLPRAAQNPNAGRGAFLQRATYRLTLRWSFQGATAREIGA